MNDRSAAGRLEIQCRDGSVMVGPGEMFVALEGVEHTPAATDECHILLVEPTGTINTGSVVDEKTAPNHVWI